MSAECQMCCNILRTLCLTMSITCEQHNQDRITVIEFKLQECISHHFLVNCKITCQSKKITINNEKMSQTGNTLTQ